MNVYTETIVAGETNPLWDVREVPLARLGDRVEGKQLVDSVMTSTKGPSLIVVSSFNSSI